MFKYIKLILIIICSCCNIATANQVASVRKVAILQTAEHPALNQTTEGIIAGLAENGFVQGENLQVRVESAQANNAMAMQIANKFVANKPDIVVGVGTMAAQSFMKYTPSGQIKLVFSSVTDPVGARLAKNEVANMPNISGVSNFIDIAPQIELIKKIQPNLKSIGIIYNPGEVNSVKIVRELEQVCQERQIKLHKQSIAKTTDALQASAKLASAVDAIFISNDNTALSCLQSIVLAAQKMQVPVYVSDTDAVPLGALAAFGPNQYELGKQTGYMLAKLLNGVAINDVAVEMPAKLELVINQQMAQKLNINIPSETLAKAVLINGKNA